MSEDALDPAEILNSPSRAAEWLNSANISDTVRGQQNLKGIAKTGITIDLLRSVLNQLETALPALSDPDMALNNLERFFQALNSPLSFATLCDRDPKTLPDLLLVLSNSQFLSDVMIRQPTVYDEMRRTQGAPVAAELLSSELAAELEPIQDDQKAIRLLNAFRRRHLVRIAYGDIIRGQTLQVVTRQISYLADVICQAALLRAHASLRKRFGTPRTDNGAESGFVILALGKLGGMELNYSSDIDLICLYDQDGSTDAVTEEPESENSESGKSIENREYFDRLVKQFVQWLTQSTPGGTAYRVDLRLRPEGSQGPSVMSRNSMLHYYDTSGRTWERQAMVKARPIAGDLHLGAGFLRQLEPWIYRNYLSQTDISGIKALKRQIERRAQKEGDDRLEVKTGHGGIRDVEFVIQFLQLLIGAESPAVRTGNTLEGIAQLATVGGLSMQERTILERNYVFLRRIEHRLQIMFDGQTHRIPDSQVEQQKLAMRLGYTDAAPGSAAVQLMAELHSKTSLNRRILDHLLHNTVGDEAAPEPEIDLVLDPSPDEPFIAEVLGKYGFADTSAAYRLLMELATERLPFLSRRRCRHFLATIAKDLLKELANTPNPDTAMVAISRVSESLGGKAALWELLNNSRPSLELYVRLCAACPYLAGILTSNPGMLDELLDSLLVEGLPTLEFLENSLAELCGGAEDIGPILASFKHAQHLRVGARDIVGKETIRTTTLALSDIAEVCLRRVAEHERQWLISKYGMPTCADGRPCELIILAAGKTGGREPNYHSDIDVIFLFEQQGSTQAAIGTDVTSNHHFFAELGRRIIKALSKSGHLGPLYAIDARLRPTGKSGALAVSLAEFEAYFESGSGQLWERMALCKARPLTGSEPAQAAARRSLRRILTEPPWTSEDASAMHDMRMQIQESASKLNLKRGPGGTVDLEFALQMLQLRHGGEHPELLITGVWQAIELLQSHGILSAADAEFVDQSYSLFRSVEARLRLMNTDQRHDIPQDDVDMNKLAFLMREQPDVIRRRCEETMRQNREFFLRIVNELS